MIDVVNSDTRSRMMAGIRSENTRPEVVTRRSLHKLGYRYRLNQKVGNIKPDVVLKKWRVAIFVHGCYWHKHKGCKLAYSDRSYSNNWKKKFEDNRLRDQRVEARLINDGWRVAVLWECATRNKKAFEKEILKLDHWIRSDNVSLFESKYRKV